MKNLILILAIVSLWGCGPQQSSTERDEQQNQAEYDRVKGFYAPFAGTFIGTQTDITGQVKEVSLYLVQADEADSNVSRVQQTAVPSLRGQILTCLNNVPCNFAASPFNESFADKVAITKAVYNPEDLSTMQIFSSGAAAAISGTSCTTGTDCTPYIYNLKISSDGKVLTGGIYNGNKQSYLLNLKRQ